MPNDGNLIVETVSTIDYRMAYNLRNVSIFMGVISMVTVFAIGSLTYLTIKLHSDIKEKFLSEEEQSDEDDGGDERKSSSVSVDALDRQESFDQMPGYSIQ